MDSHHKAAGHGRKAIFQMRLQREDADECCTWYILAAEAGLQWREDIAPQGRSSSEREPSVEQRMFRSRSSPCWTVAGGKER
jgi:hypothetical protein